MTRRITLGLFAAALSISMSATTEDPWADAVVQYSPGAGALLTDASVALGAPMGGGPSTPNNASVVSLGEPPGFLVLKFNAPVENDPANPLGLDFIVYSNAFWSGGNPQTRFEEPAIVEISEDVNGNGLADDPWYPIPGSRAFPYAPFPQINEPAGASNSSTEPYWLAGNIRNPNTFDADPLNDNIEYNWGYAEMSPAMTPYLDNYVRPDDPRTVGHTARSGGGDAFDIAWAVNASGQPANLARFHFIRLTSLVRRNMGALGTASSEIDAVANIARDVDTDGDGILDEYETRVAGTDPARKESTVLALEIPAIEGGGPPGTVLGTAEDSRGTKLRLYADAARTDPDREFNCVVDILVPAEPGLPLPSPGLIKSGTVRQFLSSETDFTAAGIQTAEVTIHYQSAEIAGLDEAGLEPYLSGGSAYSQSGISNVVANASANTVTFRTRYAGLFLLASAAGTGDAGGNQGPQGAIALTAVPPGGVVADPANAVAVTSGVIRDQLASIVPNGTFITVSTGLGQITTPDADPGTAGIQIATASGVISFNVQAPALAAGTLFRATSVQGAAYGELPYAFFPGPPAPPVAWYMNAPEGAGPVSVVLESTTIVDRFGNRVPDGTLLTLAVAGGSIVSGDAGLTLPGHQAAVIDGRVSVGIETPTESSSFTTRTYGDASQTRLLAVDTFIPANYQPIPILTAPALLAAVLALIACLRLRVRRES